MIPVKLRRNEKVLDGAVFTKRIYDFLDALQDSYSASQPHTVSSGQGISVVPNGNDYIINAAIAVLIEGMGISITPVGGGNFIVSTEYKPTDVDLITFTDSPYTVVDTFTIIQVDASGGDVIINLPSLAVGVYCCVIKTDSSINGVYVNSSDGIIGSTSVLIDTQYESIEFIGGANEYLIK